MCHRPPSHAADCTPHSHCTDLQQYPHMNCLRGYTQTSPCQQICTITPIQHHMHHSLSNHLISLIHTPLSPHNLGPRYIAQTSQDALTSHWFATTSPPSFRNLPHSSAHSTGEQPPEEAFAPDLSQLFFFDDAIGVVQLPDGTAAPLMLLLGKALVSKGSYTAGVLGDFETCCFSTFHQQPRGEHHCSYAH